jgi:hypothetical protein
MAFHLHGVTLEDDFLTLDRWRKGREGAGSQEHQGHGPEQDG